VPQVRVRRLDANLGGGRFGPAHRILSSQDLGPSIPIRSPHSVDPRLAQQKGEPGAPGLGKIKGNQGHLVHMLLNIPPGLEQPQGLQTNDVDA
jgi:hypothetical protein